jgi:cyclopropane fatty-acyl-phospholipid synthase-like methyltransferase
MFASGTRKVVTGVEYVKQMTAKLSDRRTRTAFQKLALSIAPPGGSLFDFGAGTGMDARFYAEHGLTVVAYDVDPNMSEFFSEYCRDFIDAGRVTFYCCAYREFLARKRSEGGVGVDLVTANFAPLNLITDVRELFAKFDALTGPDGKVLVSVLNPYYVGDMKYGWWWRNAFRLRRDGHYSVQGSQAPIVRRRLAEFAAHGAPYFTLKSVFPGMLPIWARDSSGVVASRGARYAWLCSIRCLFMFLLFEKSNQGSSAVRD